MGIVCNLDIPTLGISIMRAAIHSGYTQSETIYFGHVQFACVHYEATHHRCLYNGCTQSGIVHYGYTHSACTHNEEPYYGCTYYRGTQGERTHYGYTHFARTHNELLSEACPV